MALDFFDEFNRAMWNYGRESLVPLTRILETEEKIIVEVDLPLVRKKDIHLRFIEGGLEIKASLTQCIRFERWGTVQRSCKFKSFYKLIPLPNQVVREGAKATLRKGILQVELKKRIKEREYKIRIN